MASFFYGFGTPFCLDRNRNSRGIMLFIRNGIPAKDFSTDDQPIESFYVKFSFREKKKAIDLFLQP